MTNHFQTENIVVLGSTGSIGKNTLDVIALHKEKFLIYALTANDNVETLYHQCLKFQPKYALLTDVAAAKTLEQKLKIETCTTEVLAGAKAQSDIVQHNEVDIVVAGIVGAAGLLPTLRAVQSGKRILLANKEALVMAGELFCSAILKNEKALLLPVDSEHNAIFQCLPKGFRACVKKPAGVRSIILTASGGPFRDTALTDLPFVTPAQAIAHPIWTMGKKISVDSATMMNKGLEIIEARFLFQLSVDDIEVVIHPQSVIHSLVRYEDGSMLAQLGEPDMRTPIANCLAWPSRIQAGVKELDLLKLSSLDFSRVSHSRYPCLQLALDALELGGTAMAVLNAANEVAVDAFLKGQIRFDQIAPVIDHTLDKLVPRSATEVETILEEDKCARKIASQSIAQISTLVSL